MTNLIDVTEPKRNMMRALGLDRWIKARPLSAPGINRDTKTTIMVDARVTQPDGETMTMIVDVSPRTAIQDIQNEVRAALNRDPRLLRARIDQITIRPPRNG